MLKGEILVDYTNLYSSNKCKNNDEIILNIFVNSKLKISVMDIL